MNRIAQLSEVGQSIWLDFIERGMLQSGELVELVDAGVRGVTSNPTIFQQAITTSQAYDEEAEALAAGDKDAKAIFEELAVADIQAAADILLPVYEARNRSDGFVSIEVAPDLAYDVQATIAEAHRLHAAVDRPNVMIKVPATKPGIEAIRRLISDGINVNVTLIFALDRYTDVMEAYLGGLEDRRNQGKDVDGIASVASFFVSRVDTNVDDRLDKLNGERACAQGQSCCRQRQASLPPIPAGLRRPALGCAARRRCAGAASALGQHQHQEPRLSGTALRRYLDRAAHGQHHARLRSPPSATTARYNVPSIRTANRRNRRSMTSKRWAYPCRK